MTGDLRTRFAKGATREGPVSGGTRLRGRCRPHLTYISALERGVYGATIDMADKLSRVLDVEASVLLQRPARSVRDKVAWRRKIKSRSEHHRSEVVASPSKGWRSCGSGALKLGLPGFSRDRHTPASLKVRTLTASIAGSRVTSTRKVTPLSGLSVDAPMR
jgi:hypothetical protein